MSRVAPSSLASFFMLCSLYACAADRSNGVPSDAGLLDAVAIDAIGADAFDAAPLDAGALDGATLDAGALDGATLDSGASTAWHVPEAYWGVPLTGSYDCYRSLDDDQRCGGGSPSRGSGTGSAEFTAQLTPTADGFTAAVSEFYATVSVPTSGGSYPLVPAINLDVTFDAASEPTAPAGAGMSMSTSSVGENPYIVDSAYIRITHDSIVVVRDYSATVMACNEIVDHVSCTARWYVPSP